MGDIPKQAHELAGGRRMSPTEHLGVCVALARRLYMHHKDNPTIARDFAALVRRIELAQKAAMESAP